MLKLYNTLFHKKQFFSPINNKVVGLYTCGPTVYNYAHIGNLRTYVFEDILKRVLEYNNYKVKHVMNITDVGHLTSDADEGEDKMEKGAKRENKTAWEIAEFYTQAFKQNMADLNLIEPNIWCKATDHIQEQIDLVQKLVDKGYTYETSDGIYFDATKFEDYGKLANLKNQNLKQGARVDVGKKKNLYDFALWKWSERRSELHPERAVASEGSVRQMEWYAFGRMGFPGWHIECSAMATKYLGKQFDIHCGGIDHIPVHHTNEIAQSETAFGKKPWVKYWLHGEFLVIKDLSTGIQGKMAKSEGNFITLKTLKTKNLSPLAYRYFLLQTHYRKQLNFSWKALEAAEQGLKRLRSKALELKNKNLTKTKTKIKQKFIDIVNDDLDLPGALAFVWEKLKNNEINYKTLLEFDKILGLELDKAVEEKKVKIPNKIQKLLDQRKIAREKKDWGKSDELREEIRKLGFEVEDAGYGQKIKISV